MKTLRPLSPLFCFMAELTLFAQFETIEKAEKRLVVGIASTDTLDNQATKLDDGTVIAGDIVDPTAVEGALADYMKWANIREMHQNSAVGTAVKAEVVDGQLQLTARVVDDTAWEKVKAGVYKGFSIGGRIVEAVLEKLPDGRTVRRILKIVLSEISLVDRPANPEARILLWKADGHPQEAPMTIDELWTLMKAAADPAKIISMIQAARNQCELDGDLPGAELYTQAIALVMQAAGEAEAPEAEEASAADAMDEEDQVDSALTAGAKATSLHKAGRKISGGNIAAMHKVLKALIDMMAAAGDEVAVKLQAAYGMDKAALSASGDGAAALAKTAGETAGASAVKPVMDQLNKLADILQSVDGRLTAIEQQPVPGGPVLRPAEKTIAGQAPAAQPPEQPDYETVYKAAYAADLQRLAATEPNPALRADYQRQLAAYTAASPNGQAK